MRNRKWFRYVDKGGPDGDWTVKIYYSVESEKITIRRIVRIPPK
jgi:hypothetical protein